MKNWEKNKTTTPLVWEKFKLILPRGKYGLVYSRLGVRKILISMFREI